MSAAPHQLSGESAAISNGTLPLGKTLACKRCQYKKLKCSRTEPCRMCEKAGVACEYRHVDKKRKPASQDHLDLLQNRVAWLEEFVIDLQQSSPSEISSKLRSASFISSSPRAGSSVSRQSPAASSKPRRATNFHVTSDGSLSFHGPTSIYQVMFDGQERPGGAIGEAASSVGVLRNADHVLRHFDIDIDDKRIMQALVIFFKWQYPNFMFIYRDALLRDHFTKRQDSKYWSVSLLLSICALGTLMLPASEQDDFGLRCHDAAETIAMVTDLVNPSITAVQTFLCLAFYEIGAGRLSKGWSFSGIAFRMAQDLGFQKDSKLWVAPDHTVNTREHFEIRRRIYWGCYISDKLISLVFGRPVQLIYSEAEVYELETLPDPPFILPWRSVGFDDDTADKHADISMIPYISEQIKLARIWERMLSLMSSSPNQVHMSVQQQNLNSLNHDLLDWRTRLPEWAVFTVWDPIDKPLKPSIAALHLLYNSARIALNFDEATSPDTDNSSTRAREACVQAATETHSILRRFRNQHGLRNSPLIIVYGVIQAIRTLKAFGTPEELNSLMEAISEISVTWPLANIVMNPGPSFT